MKVNLYLSLVPEALVFSMLDPLQFGRYLSLGAEKRPHGQALFMEVDEKQAAQIFDLEEIRNRCRPHADGKPYHSGYVSIYRTLERLPVSTLGALYLVTRNGTTLKLPKSSQASPASNHNNRFHLYQEFCPVTPLVASRLDPVAFGSYITDQSQPVSVPAIIFAELDLGPLAQDPDHPATNLPYPNLAQIRYCLEELQKRPEKAAKIVDRKLQRDFPFWMVKEGVTVSGGSGSAFYPMPTEEELRETNFNWWSSARAVELL